MTTQATTDNAQLAKIHSLRFGFEIEIYGLGFEGTARAIQTGLSNAGIDSTRYNDSSNYANRMAHGQNAVRQADGRVWRAVYDGSLARRSAAEVVSPVLRYTDMPALQEVIRAIRAAGGKVDTAEGGMHVHVDGAEFLASPKAISNLVKLTNQQEDLIRLAIGANSLRARWARPVSQDFLAAIERNRGRSISSIRSAWYETQAPYDRESNHYNNSRYRGVNLHSLFNGCGTVEFRYFDATLHAGKVKSYIQFCLAIAAKALLARSASSRKRTVRNGNTKYAFRTFLLRLALIGDEFKSCRLHLMKNLSGSAAWSDPRDAAR